MSRTKKPYAFMATKKPFTVQLSQPCVVTGYVDGKGKSAGYYRHFPVKKGDTFKAVSGGLMVNEVFHAVRARQLKVMTYKVSWVPKRLRVAVFLDRDRIWKRRPWRPTKKFGKPYWTACDLRGDHIGCDRDLAQAIKNLILQCHATNFCAAEEEANGHPVIRWRCLLPRKEVKEMEKKARKTGFILDGIEVPPLPAHWQRSLDKLRLKAK